MAQLTVETKTVYTLVLDEEEVRGLRNYLQECAHDDKASTLPLPVHRVRNALNYGGRC